MIMNTKELRDKSKEELQTLLIEKRRNIDIIKFSLYQRKIKNVRELGQARKEVARILTVLAEGK